MRLVGRLAVRELRRDLRRRELKTVGFAMTVAVTMVTLTLMLTDTLQQALGQTSDRFIASERQLISPTPIDPAWLARAQRAGLRTAVTAEFTTMLFAGDRMQLVSAKAVDHSYPLLGSLKISDSPTGALQSVTTGPAPGKVWLSPRLQSLLSVKPGDRVELGDRSLQATKVLRWEPDVALGLSAFAPRLMMNLQDLESARVSGPGSQIKWRALFARQQAGQSISVLTELEQWLKSRRNPEQKWMTARAGQRGIARTLAKAESYLRLSGTLVLILAALAVSLSARQYAEQQVTVVALKKTLGMRGSEIIITELIKISLLAAAAALLGGVLGYSAWLLGIRWTTTLLDISRSDLLQMLHWRGLLLGAGVAWLMAYSFVLPQLWRLRRLSPTALFQSGNPHSGHNLLPLLVGGGMLVLFSLGFNHDGQLTLMLTVGLTVLLVVGSGLIRLLLQLIRMTGTGVASPVKMGFIALRRRGWQNAFHILFLATALSLLATAWSLESGLIDRWKTQLPADAPNSFLVNIDTADKASIVQQLGGRSVNDNVYPVVRGRLTQINGRAAQQSTKQPREALNRALNLTWSSKLPTDNRIVSGSWWTTADDQALDRVSISVHLADELGIKLGDRVTFSIADQTLTATVQSLRKVQWQNLRPNFYFIFPKGGLQDYPLRWMAGLYLAPQQQAELNEIVRRYPSVSVISVSEIIARVRTMLGSVSAMVELLLYLLLAAGLLVISVLINASRPERILEAVLVRAMGGQRKLIVLAQITEFGMIGLAAGLLAAPGSVLLTQLLASHWLGGESIVDTVLWLALPGIGILINGLLGYWQIRDVASQPPMRLLSSTETDVG